MDEQAFLQRLSDKAQELRINPFLLLAGLEGLYTFREVSLSALNMEYLDSLVMTLFTLRIGDQFHALAEAQLQEGDVNTKGAALRELEILTESDLAGTQTPTCSLLRRCFRAARPCAATTKKPWMPRHSRSAGCSNATPTRASAPS
ncbi:MAG: hypothetical protein EOP50_14495 [Sphingobacteriales bacterium]|nr:MAG: hypothetical protein EOP50_14495 [Sphingobacteriales bacterium]